MHLTKLKEFFKKNSKRILAGTLVVAIALASVGVRNISKGGSFFSASVVEVDNTQYSAEGEGLKVQTVDFTSDAIASGLNKYLIDCLSSTNVYDLLSEESLNALREDIYQYVVDNCSSLTDAQKKQVEDMINKSIDALNIPQMETALKAAIEELSNQESADINALKSTLTKNSNDSVSNIFNNLAAQFESDKAYAVNQFVSKDNDFYICIKDAVVTEDNFDECFVKTDADGALNAILEMVSIKDEALNTAINTLRADMVSADLELLDNITDLRTRTIVDLKDDLQSKLDNNAALSASERASLQAAIDSLDEKSADSINSLESLLNTKDTNQSEALTSTKNEMNASVNTAKTSLEGQLNALETSVESEMQAQDTEHKGLIESVKEWVSNLFNTLAERLNLTQNDISDTYNVNTYYVEGDMVMFENKLYVCKANTTGEFNKAAWVETSIDDEMAELANDMENLGKSVADGKANVAGTISGLGGTAANDASFDELSNAITILVNNTYEQGVNAASLNVDELERLVNENQQSISNISTRLSALSAVVDTFPTKYVKIADFETYKANLETQISDITNLMNEIRSLIATVEQKQAELENKHNKIMTLYESLELTAESYSLRIVELENELEEVKAETVTEEISETTEEESRVEMPAESEEVTVPEESEVQ